MSRFADRYITTQDPDEWSWPDAIGLWLLAASLGALVAVLVR